MNVVVRRPQVQVRLERHAGRRLPRAGLAARRRAAAEAARPRHVRAAVPRPRQQGRFYRNLRVRPLSAAAARARRRRCRWSTPPTCRCSSSARPNFPIARPARAPQGRPDARAGARAARAAPAWASASPSTAARASPSRPTPTRVAFVDVDEGPARVRRHAGRGPRVGHDVLEARRARASTTCSPTA